MIVKSFVDTNILVYADDPREPRKQDMATALVETALRSQLGVVSTQVLQEYFHVASRKLRLEARLLRAKIEILTQLNVVQVDTTLILAAIDLHQQHQLSFWDALVLQAAVTAGCRELLTEDMQPGFTYGGVRIVNPFA